MKTTKWIKNLLILFSFCVISTSAYAKNADWTDAAVCESVASRFNNQAFSDLFSQAPNLAFEYGKICTNGFCRAPCYIDVICKTGCDTDARLQTQGMRTIYGSIQLYRQDNSLAIFTDNKNRFGNKSKVQFSKDQSSPLKKLFPWALEGFYEFKGEQAGQEFSVYTNKGDYIIFILNYRDIKPYKQPSLNQLDERFIKFIQSTARQMGY